MRSNSSLYAFILQALAASSGSQGWASADAGQEAPAPSAAPTPTGRANRFGFEGEQTATFQVNGPDVTLSPNVHWSLDTKRTENVIPLAPHKRSQVYYGVGDINKEGQFALTTYNFLHHSVNLDHTDHVSSVKYEDGTLKVAFSLDEAYQAARQSWDKDLILIAYTKGCGDHDKGERCYFHASDLSFDDSKQTVDAKGEARHPDHITSGGETEWGRWTPTAKSGASDSSRGDSFAWGSKAENGSDDGSELRRRLVKRDESDFGPSRDCQLPQDNTFGLPTSCLDEWFDVDIDDQLGYEDMTEAYQSFLGTIDEAEAGQDSQRLRRMMRARAIERRGLFGWLSRKTLETLKKGYKAVKDALTITASINKELAWKLPQTNGKAFDKDKLKENKIKQVESPWGDSILLKSFTSSKTKTKSFAKDLSRETGRESYMNIYCVGCGVSGSAKLAGSARWTLDGFQAGFVDIRADMRIALKLGIDAQVTYKAEFRQNMFDVGLPGLSYGLVTIGPRVSVASKVALEAAANGKLLAGAEMGIENAHAKIHFVKSDEPSTQSGWQPYFKPTFQASGEIAVSASLGFPITLACGIKAGSVDASVSLIDEPSIKLGAQFAGAFGLKDDGKKAAVWSGDIEETEGCLGISTALTWRNEIKADILGLTEFTLHDTEDMKIKSGCIGIETGKKPEDPKGNPGKKATADKPKQPPGKKPTSDKTRPAPGKPSATPDEDERSKFGREGYDLAKSTECTKVKLGGNVEEAELTDRREAEQACFEEQFKDFKAGKTAKPKAPSKPYDGPIDKEELRKFGQTDYDSDEGLECIKGKLGGNVDDAELTDRREAGQQCFEEQFRVFKGEQQAKGQQQRQRLRKRQEDDDFEQDDGNAGQDDNGAQDDQNGGNGADDNGVDDEINPEDVEDQTDDVIPGRELNQVLYEFDPFPNHEYTEDGPDKLVYDTLLDPDDTTMVISCSNGNMFAVTADSGHNDACSELWAGKGRNVVVADGAGKMMHYYSESMERAGVSRLRVSDSHEAPRTSVPVLLALYQDSFFVAVDAQEEAYYPLVCDYEDEKIGSKVFVAKSPEEGIRTLENPNAENSITGGKVSQCFPLVLGPPKDDEGDYLGPDDSETVKLDVEGEEGQQEPLDGEKKKDENGGGDGLEGKNNKGQDSKGQEGANQDGSDRQPSDSESKNAGAKQGGDEAQGADKDTPKTSGISSSTTSATSTGPTISSPTGIPPTGNQAKTANNGQRKPEGESGPSAAGPKPAGGEQGQGKSKGVKCKRHQEAMEASRAAAAAAKAVKV